VEGGGWGTETTKKKVALFGEKKRGEIETENGAAQRLTRALGGLKKNYIRTNSKK